MEPFRDNDLAAELRALRPLPRPEFAAELDERVAAGFPRRSPHGDSPMRRIAALLRAVPPRRFLLPAGAGAVTAIAIATAVIANSESRTNLSHSVQPRVQYSAVPPTTEKAPAKAAGSGNASAAQSSESLSRSIPFSYNNGAVVFKARDRDIERSAQIVLGADPEQVRASAAKVFDAVHVANGIVLRSSISDGAAGEAGARFDLLIPGAKLGDALAAFSDIAEVRSRHEATEDITAPTIGVGERLQDSRAKIDGLLDQLAAADTDAERVAAKAELRSERQHAASLRSRLTELQRRANLTHVSLRIETGANSASSGDAGGWGVDDALGDAGHILAVAAGVTVIGLAIVAPLALIALLAWLAHRGWLRARREQALARRS